MQEFKGYVFKIMGGQDKQGFPMKQGVLTQNRVDLLMKPGDACFRGFGRRKGERRRKAVRGCIVTPELSVLNLAIVKQGEALQITAISMWSLIVVALRLQLHLQCTCRDQPIPHHEIIRLRQVCKASK